MSRTREGIVLYSLSVIRSDEGHIVRGLAMQKHKSEYIKALITKDMLEKGLVLQEDLDKIEAKRIEKAMTKKKKNSSTTKDTSKTKSKKKGNDSNA